MKKIGLILGTNRPSRIGKHIADWVIQNFESNTLSIELIDLKDVNLPFLDEPDIPAKHQYTKQHTLNWSKKISSLDGVILLYPQYNWGYPAVLKNALDYLYDEWKDMPAASIVYGNHGGFQAQIALNLVLHGLHMDVMNTNIGLALDTLNFQSQSELEKYRPDISSLVSEFERKL